MSADSAVTPLPPNIALLLRRTRWRLRARQALAGLAYGLGAGLVVGVVAAIVARLQPLLAFNDLLRLSLGALGLGLALGGLLGALRPLPLRVVAARCDDELELRERVSTALELSSGTARSTLAPLQLAETAALLRERDTAVAPLPRLDQRAGTALAVLAGLLALLLVLPNRQDAALRQQAAQQQQLQQTVQQVNQIQAQVQARTDLDPETKRIIEQQLAQLQRDLATGQLDRGQAVARIAAAEAELRALQNPNARREASSLPALADELKPFGPTADIGQRLAAGDYVGAGQALKDLGQGLSGLDPSSQAALAQKLREAAAAQTATNPQLAQQLQDAADALARGDTAAAQQALDRAGDLLAQAGQQAASQEQLAQVLGDLNQLKRDTAAGLPPNLAQATPQRATGSPAALGGTPGRPLGTPVTFSGTPGAMNGQGTPVALNGSPAALTFNGTPVRVGTGQANQGGTPVAAPAQGGQGQGQTGTGAGGNGNQAGGQQPGGGAGQGGGGQPGDYDPVYAPTLPGGPPGQQQQASGSGNTGAPPTGATQGPGAGGAPSVPYDQVYQHYLAAVQQALDNGSIPPELRDYIRDYFSNLDPQNGK